MHLGVIPLCTKRIPRVTIRLDPVLKLLARKPHRPRREPRLRRAPHVERQPVHVPRIPHQYDGRGAVRHRRRDQPPRRGDARKVGTAAECVVDYLGALRTQYMLAGGTGHVVKGGRPESIHA